MAKPQKHSNNWLIHNLALLGVLTLAHTNQDREFAETPQCMQDCATTAGYTTSRRFGKYTSCQPTLLGHSLLRKYFERTYKAVTCFLDSIART
ncbi:hypothetical protein R3P38DRAFT_2898765 [Favolaschia claudopus]|uniref:Secreted protein n=1 Tax=Favolaschia claudopus TaxID=2862362 RepID=A0AAW0CL80_9AGAR